MTLHLKSFFLGCLTALALGAGLMTLVSSSPGADNSEVCFAPDVVSCVFREPPNKKDESVTYYHYSLHRILADNGWRIAKVKLASPKLIYIGVEKVPEASE